MNQTQGAFLGILGGISVSGILEYFSLSGESIIIMTAMLLTDLVFGLLSAKARGEKIESKKLQLGLMRKMTRRILPFIVAGGLKRTGMPGIDMLNIAIVGMIVFSELYSIIGHIYSINYKEELPEIDAFKMLLNSICKLLKNIIKKKNDEIEPKEDLFSKEQGEGKKHEQQL